MKSYAKNIIMIMSAGIGARFGADCPKQYHLMSGRLVIDYVVDACRASSIVDEIVVVASGSYVDFVSDRYNLPVVEGGSTRPESVANGVKYIHEHYACQKLIITNAVCPLASTEQYDKYFQLLDDYDFVLTTWKLAPALHRFDGVKVDRDEFFNVMEPDAYNFPMLYESYDFHTLKKYIFHNMPDQARAYFCFDYPYTYKVTYPFDIPVLEVLYNQLIKTPDKDNTLQIVSRYLSVSGLEDTTRWISDVQKCMQEIIVPKYSIISYSLNKNVQANLVYEAESNAYGSLHVKFAPSEFHFHKELVYYKYAAKDIMADLVGYDEEYHMLVLKSVKPGIEVKFDEHNISLRRFFDRVNANFIPETMVRNDKGVPTVIDEFNEVVTRAGSHSFALETRSVLEEKTRLVYKKYFSKSQLYYLHRDLQKRNILKYGEEVRAIDPRGAIGPKEFEFVSMFVIELRELPEFSAEVFWNMFSYFESYCNVELLLASLFCFFCYKVSDYTYHKNDTYALATWMLKTTRELFFFDNDDQMKDPDALPDFAKILAEREKMCR